MTHSEMAGSAMPMRPEDVLPDHQDHTERDGLVLRKGTVAAFLHNAMRWSDSSVSEEERAALAREIALAAPALRALGVFKVFEVRDPVLRALLVEP